MNFWSAFEMLAAAMDGRLALPRSRGQRCPAHRVLCLPGKGHHLAEGAAVTEQGKPVENVTLVYWGTAAVHVNGNLARHVTPRSSSAK